MSNRKLAGIWLDSENAMLVTNHDTQNITEFSLSGNFKHEKQGANSNENTANNSLQTTTAKYFKEIDKALENTEELYITGPGKIQEELKSFLHDTPQFKNLKIALDTSERMSDTQLIDAAKSHFGV